jgi:hypothetical protein
LLPQRPNLCLKRCPRPEQIDDRPTNKSAKIPHPTTGLPDSRSTASRIRFATRTGFSMLLRRTSARRSVSICGRPSPAQFPTPVAANASLMPPHDGLRLDDRDDLQDRREPPVRLDQEPTVGIRQRDPSLQLAPQHDQLMSQHCIFCLKPAVRLEWRGQESKE